MKIIEVNNKKISDEAIKKIVGYLKEGRVIVYPTDTIYGLGCLATDKQAIKRIFKIKQREKNKPLLVLVDSLAMAKKYCVIGRHQEIFLKYVWTFENRPTSVILKSKNVLPKELIGESNALAVRLPKDDFLIKLIKKIGAPLVSTSLNISGRESLTKVDGLDGYFKKQSPKPPLSRGHILPDLIINAGEIKGKPSRLVDLRDVSDIKIVRK